MRAERQPVFLLTAVVPSKREGASPTGLVGRHLARQLLDRGVSVRILAEPGQLEGWPPGSDVVQGSITNLSGYGFGLVPVDPSRGRRARAPVGERLLSLHS